MANSTTKILRNNIKTFRESKNLTQEKLSELAGISADYNKKALKRAFICYFISANIYLSESEHIIIYYLQLYTNLYS